MEFVDMGGHCQQEGCKQQDFLPFKCNVCTKTLCLAHRSYVAHECVGSLAKDMTSLDCPICGRSVKFTRADVSSSCFHYL